MEDYTEGTIVEFRTSWSSGLATLIIKDDENVIHYFHCDSGPTGRALDAAFDAIGPGHTILNDKIRGKRIRAYMDDFDLCMAYFEVVE